MEAADHGVKPVGAGNRHRGPDRVHDAGMAAGRDDDQSAPADQIAGRVLLRVAVEHQLPAAFGFAEMVGNFELGAAGDLLEGIALDIAGGEGAIERQGSLAAHRRNLVRDQRVAVRSTPGQHLRLFPRRRRTGRNPAHMKRLLGTDVEAQVVAHPVPVARHETLQAAIVIAVPVAQDQAVQPCRIDVQQFEIPVQDLRRIAEIEQVPGLMPACRRFEMQREAPFAGERCHMPSGDHPDMLDIDVGVVGFRQKELVAGVDDDPDRQVIDHRRFERNVPVPSHRPCSAAAAGIPDLHVLIGGIGPVR